MILHPILTRQITKHTKYVAGKDDIPAEWTKLFAAISDAYYHFDEDLALSSRSLDLSSKELSVYISLLKSTIESIIEGILVVDNSGRSVIYNSKFVSLWGIPEEVLNTHEDSKMLDFVTKQLKNPDVFLGKVKELYSQPNAESHDILEFKDGRIFDRHSTPQLIGNKSVGRVWSFQDITKERKEEENKTALLNAIPDLMFHLNKDGVFINFKGSRDDLYVESENIIGKQISDILPFEVADLAKNKIKVALDTKELQSFEYSITLPKKGLRNFEARMVGSGVDEVVAIIRDITEQKKVIDELKKEQIFSNTIIVSIPGAFYVLDEKGQYVRWNAYQRDEIIGKPENMIAGINAINTIHPDDRALIQSKIENVLINGKDESVEGRVILRGGPDSRWLLMTGHRMMLNGKSFLIGTGTDINDRKIAEEKFKNKYDEMEKLYKMMVGREKKMSELKKEIEELKAKLESK